MNFCDEPFDVCWAHIRECARADQEEENWIPTLAGKPQGNQVIACPKADAIRVRSGRPVGKGWRDIPRSEFHRLWSWLRGERDRSGRSHDATAAIVIRYFDDVAWSADEKRTYVREPVETPPVPPGVPATGAGPSPYERRAPMSAAQVEGRHRAIHAAVTAGLDRAGGWTICTLPAGATLIPDLMVRSAASGRTLLFEIKSGNQMADIYEAVGQLQLYGALYADDDPNLDRIIVQPESRGRSELVAALRRLGIRLLPARPVAGRWIIRGLANVLAESEPHEAN